MKRKSWERLASIMAVLAASPLVAPQLLAFPYRATVRAHRIYAEQPIDSRLAAIIANADTRAAQSPIAKDRVAGEPIFLTDGGWRWAYLSAMSRDSFAFNRQVGGAVVVNRNDPAKDLVTNGRALGGQRTITATIVHELTHTAIRAHFGLLADHLYPAWLREGYCDFVSGGGSLSDADAAALIANKEDHPALVYWRGRKRVEAELAANGGSVDSLFAKFGS